ncbi:hypothetical protein QM716_14245 [Rhodococcus sp. IEGM 1409]|uniref:hypothetical protein n=1 Tax=Rhodococcus sp. IEGM 1409 TaxID=3047082 RepID=UPI0024B6B79F|nr:hypothetical protein [Rhodococcus sp. IEGM 1409]MDI9901016.1 hypothetical protein [Rhodococcus sp. IEGM 1409]
MKPSGMFVGASALLLLVSCGSAESPVRGFAPAPPTVDLSMLEPATCLADNLVASLGTGVIVSEPKSIPDGFTPTQVITCDFGANGNGDVSADHMVGWVEQHHRGDLSAVLSAFRVPSDLRDPSCMTDQPVPPTVWLVDDRGYGMRPHVPQGTCGQYKWDAIEAVNALPVADTIVHQVPVGAR